MKAYKYKSETLDSIREFIILDLGDGSYESFEADDNNQRYQEWKTLGITPEPWEP